MSDKNEMMRKRIIEWGLPECLKRSEYDLTFKFDDDGINDTKEREYHCEDGNVKFCLFDEKSKKVLFSMDFFESGSRMSSLMKTKRIKLELLYVHDASLRKKGIASYFIKKLQKYAIEEKFEQIFVIANANANNFKETDKDNALSQKELEDFYEKLSTPAMPIITRAP
ncbi:GNAT family protein [Bacillus paralicheniformis]|uniref:hypothetical protein n=1 Tax=Bacillus paralicheniformis TaxID=1648923 RepID=UPI003981CEDC